MASQLIRSLTYLAEPVGLVWFLLLVAVGYALRKRWWKPALYLGAVALFMSLMGSTGLPGWLVSTLERPFVRPQLDQVPVCDAVVVLGGAVQSSRYEAFGLDLMAEGDRVIMALELMRRGKATALVLGGSAYEINGQLRVEADMLRQWLLTWQVPAAPILSLGGCNGTHDEAVKVAQLARERAWNKVMVVTSAYHMRRAAAAFRTAGLAVECVPCDFRTSVSIESRPSYTLVPRYQGFLKTSLYVHEQVGWCLYRWRGWIDRTASRATP